MTIRHTIAAACLVLSAPTLAAAQTQGANTPLSLDTLQQRLVADGFRVVEIERYANSIEIKGYDRTGQCFEMHLDPQTGEVLRRERDDDCARSDDDGDHGRRHSSH